MFDKEIILQKKLMVLDKLLTLSGKDNIKIENNPVVKEGKKLISIDLENYLGLDKVTIITEKQDDKILILMTGRKDGELEVYENDHTKSVIKCLKTVESETEIYINNEKLIATEYSSQRNTFYSLTEELREYEKTSNITYLYCCNEDTQLDNIEHLDKMINTSKEHPTFKKEI